MSDFTINVPIREDDGEDEGDGYVDGDAADFFG